MKTGEIIAYVREALQMTTREFGGLVGISHSYVAQLEGGVRKPSQEVATKIKDVAKSKAKIKLTVNFDKNYEILQIM